VKKGQQVAILEIKSTKASFAAHVEVSTISSFSSEKITLQQGCEIRYASAQLVVALDLLTLGST
jgi:hypothetical protein